MEPPGLRRPSSKEKIRLTIPSQSREDSENTKTEGSHYTSFKNPRLHHNNENLPAPPVGKKKKMEKKRVFTDTTE